MRLGDHEEALSTLDRAISTNRNNPIAKFHRAKVLEAVGRNEVGMEGGRESRRVEGGRG